MRDFDAGRRKFIKTIAALPMAIAVNTDPLLNWAVAYASTTGPEESLKKLILIVGPWTDSERDKAGDFASRFLKHASEPYLRGNGKIVKSLAARFPGDIYVKEIALKGLPAEERKLLIDLSMQIYSLVEVRFFVSHEPGWGVCLGNRKRYTRPPR